MSSKPDFYILSSELQPTACERSAISSVSRIPWNTITLFPGVSRVTWVCPTWFEHIHNSSAPTRCILSHFYDRVSLICFPNSVGVWLNQKWVKNEQKLQGLANGNSGDLKCRSGVSEFTSWVPNSITFSVFCASSYDWFTPGLLIFQ